MFGWYRELSAKERRTFWGCFGGWGLDAMDVQIFSFLMPALISAWALSRQEAGLLGTAALLSSAIGGWVCGIIADRVGRVRMMQITVLWYSLFTCLSGFAQSFDQLLVLRVLQGLGFGGEWAAGAVLMGEIIRPAHRGKALGCVQSAYAVGWAAAAIVSTVCLTLLPPHYGWRVVFWSGLAPAVLVIFIRRFIDEPEIFKAAKNHREAAQITISPWTIFSPRWLGTSLLAALLALGLQGSGNAIAVWLPTFLKADRGLSVVAAGLYVFVVTAGSFFGFVTSGYVSDALGRRRGFVVFSAASLVVVAVYLLLPLSGTTALVAGFVLGFCTLGCYSALGPVLTELYPTEIRAAGQSFAYNFGRAFGALFVAFVGTLSQIIPLGHSIGVITIIGYVLAIIAALLLPETRGKALTQMSVDAADNPQGATVLLAEGSPGE